jgi:hypothetical protein
MKVNSYSMTFYDFDAFVHICANMSAQLAVFFRSMSRATFIEISNNIHSLRLNSNLDESLNTQWNLMHKYKMGLVLTSGWIFNWFTKMYVWLTK